MTIDQAKDKVKNDIQHYYNKEQVIELLDKLTIKPTSHTLTLF
jgi:hypothetical protein